MGITIPRPTGRLLDLTRLVRRAGRRFTGVDRVEFAYLRALLADEVSCWALVRTPFGYLMLDEAGMAQFAQRLQQDTHRRAFFAFLSFLKGNLAGQIAVRADAAWCTQAQAIAGFGEFALPDRIIREKDLEVEFASLIAPMGYQAPVIFDVPECGPFLLAEAYDATVEQRVADVYQRDYMMFGFDSWR